MNRLRPFLLSVLTGLLLYAAWPPLPLTPLIFVAWVPLIHLGQQTPKRGRFFLHAYLALLIWNAGTTWWMCMASVPGGISAILANSLLMSFPWMGFHLVHHRMGRRWGMGALLAFWMSFEYVHLNWDLSWPWLTLGNVFSNHPGWIQWYEYTGSSGGTFWIMVVNLLVISSVVAGRQDGSMPWRMRPLRLGALALAILFPLLLSGWILLDRQKALEAQGPRKAFNIVVVQPNIDPWDEKFEAGKQEWQVQHLIQLSLAALDSNTRLIVWPETAIPVSINEDSMAGNYFLRPVWALLKSHPQVNLVTGIEGFRFLDDAHKTEYSRPIPQSNLFFDTYNSEVLMDSSHFQVYHKSRLVPGAEVLPSFLHFMEAWFEKFGGTTGSYARQKERTVLRAFNGSYQVAPAVCYESIYGEFMAEYVRNGASLLCVITNDGWWGNTEGYLQHESYSRLRALETRRWVARSANTGISCFISPLGVVLRPLPWNQSSATRLEVPALQAITFFVRYGDLLSKSSLVATALIALWWLWAIIQSKRQRGKRNRL